MTRERSLHVRLIATCALAALPATADERAELVRIESAYADMNDALAAVGRRAMAVANPRSVAHPERWAVRVQLVGSPGYIVNHGLGAVLTADLLRDFLRRPVSPDALIADTGRIGG